MGDEFTDEEILGGYYSALEPNGKLMHAKGVNNVVEQIHNKVGGDRTQIQKKVHQVFSETIGPEYLKPAALDLISRAIMFGGDVYIWTVGDHGEGSHYYQRAKIEASRIVESLRYILLKNNVNQDLVNQNFHTVISSESKNEKLIEIVNDIQSQGIFEIFIADDKESNLFEAREVVNKFAVIGYHEWVIRKDSDAQGNLSAFRDNVLDKMGELAKNNTKFALILDWDDTLTYEIERMKDIKVKLSNEFRQSIVKSKELVAA